MAIILLNFLLPYERLILLYRVTLVLLVLRILRPGLAHRLRIPDLVDWPLVTAARGIVGSLSGWTVVVSGVDSYTASLRVSPASESGEQTVLLSLTRNQPGLMVIVAGR